MKDTEIAKLIKQLHNNPVTPNNNSTKPNSDIKTAAADWSVNRKRQYGGNVLTRNLSATGLENTAKSLYEGLGFTGLDEAISGKEAGTHKKLSIGDRIKKTGTFGLNALMGLLSGGTATAGKVAATSVVKTGGEQLAKAGLKKASSIIPNKLKGVGKGVAAVEQSINLDKQNEKSKRFSAEKELDSFLKPKPNGNNIQNNKIKELLKKYKIK